MKTEKEHFHILAMLVNNEPGVLSRISGMFRKRNFNIESLTVGHSSQPGISRMTIAFHGKDKTYRQLIKQLENIYDVIKTEDLPTRNSIIRDLALIKVRIRNKADKERIDQLCSKDYMAKVVYANADSAVVEIVDTPEKVNGFLKEAEKSGIREIARAGVTAMFKGHDQFEVL